MKRALLVLLALGCQESSRGVDTPVPDAGTPPFPTIEIMTPDDHAPNVTGMLELSGVAGGAERVEVLVDDEVVVAAGVERWRGAGGLSATGATSASPPAITCASTGELITQPGSSTSARTPVADAGSPALASNQTLRP